MGGYLSEARFMDQTSAQFVVWFGFRLVAYSLFCFVLGGVHKLRLQDEGGRWSKKLTFCKPLYHRQSKRRGVGGQKKPNLVNVVCERPLILSLHFIHFYP